MDWELIRKKHYDNHLSEHYSELFGGYWNNIDRNLRLFNESDIKPVSNSIALDLGCGNGFQSIPLSIIGFEVFSVDSDGKLLDEFKHKLYETNSLGNKLKSEIHLISDDIFDYLDKAEIFPELVVCMGDTVSHFESENRVLKMIEKSHDILKPGGKLVLSFRDYTDDIEDKERFIFLGGGKEIFFECFVEKEENGTRLKTYDIFHKWDEKCERWVSSISHYYKTILNSESIDTFAVNLGMEIDKSEKNRGMFYKIYKKIY